MDWGNWVWRSKFFSATEPDSTRETSEGFGLLIFCNLQKQYGNLLRHFGGMNEPDQKKNDGREEWISQVGETHTLYLLLMKHWSINSRYPLAKERIQWKSSFPQSYMCVFFPIESIQSSNTGIGQLLSDLWLFRKWGLHLLKSTAGNPKITCLKSKIIFHPPLPACTLENPPWTTKIGGFWFGQKWAPPLLVESQAQAARLRRDVRRLHECLDGAVSWINSIHECLVTGGTENWGFMMQWLEMIQFDVRIFFQMGLVKNHQLVHKWGNKNKIVFQIGEVS